MGESIWISMNRDGLRAFADRLLAACDEGGLVLVELEADHNGSGPPLTLRFDNDDMERDDVTASTAYWDRPF